MQRKCGDCLLLQICLKLHQSSFVIHLLCSTPLMDQITAQRKKTLFFHGMSTFPIVLIEMIQGPDFFTGLSKVPATGFDCVPKIKFIDGNRLPTASTCELSITFPREMASLTVDEFKEKMDFCIHGSHGYGVV